MKWFRYILKLPPGNYGELRKKYKDNLPKECTHEPVPERLKDGTIWGKCKCHKTHHFMYGVKFFIVNVNN